jgi:acetyltransferase-like isoleucine patch superfamily enzyme
MNEDRKLPWDWYEGTIPENVSIDGTAYLETSYSFHLYRSALDCGVRMGRGASAYLGTMFDVGPRGSVRVGDFTLVHGAWFISDRAIEVGDYTFISWNVVLMDTYRASLDAEARRRDLENVPSRSPRSPQHEEQSSPITVGSNVWIGFDACVLPGVRIGDGCIIGARSVVTSEIPAYCIAAGNPARVVREIARPRE